MPVTLGELAKRFGCDLDGDPDIVVTGVSSLANATAETLTFLSNSRLKSQLSSTRAAAVILRAGDRDACPVASLVADDPYAVFARIAGVLHPPPAPQAGIHPSAVVDDSATVAASAQIDAHAVIGERAVIGENVCIGPGCFIGPDCVIGDDCRFIANVTLPRQVTIGKRGVFHPGVVVGADGFGNAMTPEGWIKVPQLGGVVIGDDVEIGANSTVDCGALGDTVIEDGVRIDNLCMLAHNVRVGAHTALAAQTGIAGSTTIGKRCMFAGQSGSVGHVNICDDVIVSGQSMVSKDINEPGVYASSFTAENVRSWNRGVARFRRLGALLERVRKLEKGDE